MKDWLIRQQLVQAADLENAIRRRGGTVATVAALFSLLEQQGLLTDYQVSKLRKGETDLLRLGRYKILYRNASGSFARVYRGCSIDDGSMVGIKVLRGRWASDPRVVSQFVREAELGKRFKHKNIVPIYDVGTDGDQTYMVMEFVEGGNLRDLLRSRKKFTAADAARVVAEIAEALEYALKLGFTHRDMKLTNVLLSAQGVAKLVDFGLAGVESNWTGIDSDVDRAIEYATLEKHTKAPPGDPRSDLFFLGVILYELLTGVPPYQPTANREERKQFSRYSDIRPIRQVDPNIPRALERVVEQLLEVHPAFRYQSPSDVARDLRRFLAEREGLPGSPTASAGSGGNAATDSSLERTSAGTQSDSASQAESSVKDAAGTSTSSRTSSQPLMLCVESRIKQQDALRQYFTRHGYRVLLLTSLERAIARLKSNPPQYLLLTSDSLGKDPVASYRQALAACFQTQTILITVLAKSQGDCAAEMGESPISGVLIQPVTMRSIRQVAEQLAGNQGAAAPDSDEILTDAANPPPDPDTAVDDD